WNLCEKLSKIGSDAKIPKSQQKPTLTNQACVRRRNQNKQPALKHNSACGAATLAHSAATRRKTGNRTTYGAQRKVTPARGAAT
ncbi:hypothetical protein A2U01_0068613, partial [Trifolium medium]|nr:hypothetical protein [Trifolium medium]